MRRLRRRSAALGEGDEEPEVDVIPLIDVVFLLLTFFIFVTLSMVLQRGVPVDLAPAATGASVEQQNEPIVISVRASGGFALDKERVSREELRGLLRRRSRGPSPAPVFLNADRAAEHRFVIEALDLVRSSGLRDVTFTVKPER